MNMNPIPLPEVARVHTQSGSHIEPDCPDEGRTDMLAWHAAVTALDSGLPIRLFGSRGVYALSIGSSGHSALDFHNAWLFLTGVLTGAIEARR